MQEAVEGSYSDSAIVTTPEDDISVGDLKVSRYMEMNWYSCMSL